jgi:hypothetical protein
LLEPNTEPILGDRLAQPAACERGGELVVLEQLRDDGDEQLREQIEQPHRPPARDDLNRPGRIASGRSCGRASMRSTCASMRSSRASILRIC